MKKLLVFFFLFATPAFALPVNNPHTGKPDFCVTIQESDGSPQIHCPGVVNFANGNVTDNGDNTVTIADNAGSGGALIQVSEDSATVVSADTVNYTTGFNVSGSGTIATVSADYATTTVPGIASFDTANFGVTGQGFVNVKSGGIDLTDEVTGTLPVTNGGTGASSLTDGGVLLGSGTGAITAMAVLADGEVIVGDGTTDPVAESGATLRTSIGLGTGDAVSFNSIHVAANARVSGDVAVTGDISADEVHVTTDFDVSGDAAVVNLEATGYLDLTEISEPSDPGSSVLRTWAEANGGFGQIHFKNSNGLDYQLAKDMILTVRNNTGGTLSKGEWVYINGSTGVFPTVAKADADSPTTMPAMGVVIADIATANFGQIQTAGDAAGLDTSSFSAGDVLYISAGTAGTVTTTAPTGTNILQRVGVVVTSNAATGIVQVLIGGEFDPTITRTFQNVTIAAADNVIEADTGDSATGFFSSGTLEVARGGTGASTLNDLITLTTHTTGNYVATLTSGDGVILGGYADGEGATAQVSVDIVSVDGVNADSTLAQSESGLQFIQGRLTMLRGCGDNEILVWDETEDDWNCEASSGTSQWTDLGRQLHPADSSGDEDVIIGAVSQSTADVFLSANGAAVFNEQGGTVGDFRIEGNAQDHAVYVSYSSAKVGIRVNDLAESAAPFQVALENSGALVSTFSFENSATSTDFDFNRARGTQDVPDNLQAKDNLGRFVFRGRVGGAYTSYSLVGGYMDTAASGGLTLQTRGLSGGVTERVRINDDGDFIAVGDFASALVATVVSRDQVYIGGRSFDTAGVILSHDGTVILNSLEAKTEMIVPRNVTLSNDGATSLKISADSIMVQAGSGTAGQLPASTDVAIPLIFQKDFTFVEPDQINTVSADIPLIAVDSYNYPNGITLTAARISLSGSASARYGLTEWTTPDGLISGTISSMDEFIVDSATELTHTSFNDSFVDVGGYLMASIDTTNVNWAKGTVWYYAND